MDRLTKKVENEERYIANNFKKEKGERLLKAIDNFTNRVYNKLGQLEDLEQVIGCPLEIRCKVVPDSYIYTFGTSMENLNIIIRRKVITISKEGIYISYATVSGKERDMTLPWKAYKKTWWLRKDQSE